MREPGKIERDGEKPAALSVKGAGEVRAGDQPKDRQAARPRSAADTAGLRRRSAVPLGLMVARTFSIRRVGSPIGEGPAAPRSRRLLATMRPTGLRICNAVSLLPWRTDRSSSISVIIPQVCSASGISSANAAIGGSNGAWEQKSST